MNTVAADGASASAYDTVDRRLRIVIGVLCLIGIGVAGYLTYTHYAGLKVVCLSSGGCETVQSSVYSKLDGVPVAVLGLAGYIGILFSLFIRNELGRDAGFGLAQIGFKEAEHGVVPGRNLPDRIRPFLQRLLRRLNRRPDGVMST